MVPLLVLGNFCPRNVVKRDIKFAIKISVRPSIISPSSVALGPITSSGLS